MKAANQKKDTSLLLLTNGPACEPTHDEIALRAYSLWEQQGHPQNQEVAIWLQAETQLRQSQQPHGVRA
jgi:hypothetical protein